MNFSGIMNMTISVLYDRIDKFNLRRYKTGLGHPETPINQKVRCIETLIPLLSIFGWLR